MAILPTNTPLGSLNITEVYQYYDGPRLFACENRSGSVFMALWLGDDEDVDEWIYVPVSSSRFEAVRSGLVSLRQAVVTAEDKVLWRVSVPQGGGIANAVPVSPSSLDDYDLPSEESFLALSTQSMPSQVEAVAMRASRILREVLDYAIDPVGSLRNTAPVAALADALGGVQKLIEALVLSRAGYRGRKGRVPTSLQQEAQLVATGFFPSSFGVRMEAKAPSNLFGQSRVGKAIEDLLNLVDAGVNEDALRALLQEHGGRVAARYVTLLKSLSENKSGVKLAWGRPIDEGYARASVMDWEQALRAQAILIQRIAELEDTVQVVGRLEGVNVHSRSFSLLDLESNERYSGPIDDSVVSDANRAATQVPADYLATIRQTQEVNPVTGEVAEKYRLMKLADIRSGGLAV